MFLIPSRPAISIAANARYGFSCIFAFDSRTEAFYVPAYGSVGVAVIAGG